MTRDLGFTVRDADPAEYARVGACTADAYEASSEFTGPFDSEYDAALRDAAGRADSATLLVAVDDDGTILGTATLARGGTTNAHVSRSHEQDLRMLGVDEKARGRGIGSALAEECAFRTGLDGGSALVISVYVANAPANRMYAKQGFVRDPGRDWTPMIGVDLAVFRRPLHCARCGDLRDDSDHSACDAALEFEPPRYCPACRRRMTVQVRPTGWTATCSQHGTATR